MKNGKLVISLDFELLWGVFDKVNFNSKEQYFCNTRKIIPEILNLFEKYEIHCTWATVGMLFNANWDEWDDNLPKSLPNYDNSQLSPYLFANHNKNNKLLRDMCFAPDLINKIRNVPFQEIGSHTYSHYYCLEQGQTIKSFKSDLKKNLEIAKKHGLKITSLVLPRNQFNNSYISVCRELGITSIRINPSNWYWNDTSKDSILKRVFRTGDAYWGRMDKIYENNKDINEMPSLQKASRLLRPYSSYKLLNNIRTYRIKNEMIAAAKERKIYHLWWHPHNFGVNTTENLNDLEDLLKHYRALHFKYDFTSLNMSEL